MAILTFDPASDTFADEGQLSLSASKAVLYPCSFILPAYAIVDRPEASSTPEILEAYITENVMPRVAAGVCSFDVIVATDFKYVAFYCNAETNDDEDSVLRRYQQRFQGKQEEALYLVAKNPTKYKAFYSLYYEREAIADTVRELVREARELGTKIAYRRVKAEARREAKQQDATELARDAFLANEAAWADEKKLMDKMYPPFTAADIARCPEFGFRLGDLNC